MSFEVVVSVVGGRATSRVNLVAEQVSPRGRDVCEDGV